MKLEVLESFMTTVLFQTYRRGVKLGVLKSNSPYFRLSHAYNEHVNYMTAKVSQKLGILFSRLFYQNCSKDLSFTQRREA